MAPNRDRSRQGLGSRPWTRRSTGHPQAARADRGPVDHHGLPAAEPPVVPGQPVDEHLRRYALRQTSQRLHQPVFRASVLHAYESRCAVCALRHPELLDAAHIVADREEGGIAAVRNGLALCKIHHAAYDVSVLGIRPDLVVEIRADLLAEIDGPMLEHGLKGRHRQQLMAVPQVRAQRPDPELLEQRYEHFRSAG